MINNIVFEDKINNLDFLKEYLFNPFKNIYLEDYESFYAYTEKDKILDSNEPYICTPFIYSDTVNEDKITLYSYISLYINEIDKDILEITIKIPIKNINNFLYKKIISIKNRKTVEEFLLIENNKIKIENRENTMEALLYFWNMRLFQLHFFNKWEEGNELKYEIKKSLLNEINIISFINNCFTITKDAFNDSLWFNELKNGLLENKDYIFDKKNKEFTNIVLDSMYSNFILKAIFEFKLKREDGSLFINSEYERIYKTIVHELGHSIFGLYHQVRQKYICIASSIFPFFNGINIRKGSNERKKSFEEIDNNLYKETEQLELLRISLLKSGPYSAFLLCSFCNIPVIDKDILGGGQDERWEEEIILKNNFPPAAVQETLKLVEKNIFFFETSIYIKAMKIFFNKKKGQNLMLDEYKKNYILGSFSKKIKDKKNRIKKMNEYIKNTFKTTIPNFFINEFHKNIEVDLSKFENIILVIDYESLRKEFFKWFLFGTQKINELKKYSNFNDFFEKKDLLFKQEDIKNIKCNKFPLPIKDIII